MFGFYNFVSGPLVWVAFIVFFGGSLYKLINMIFFIKKKEEYIFSYLSFKYSLRSILHWSTPFASVGMRKNPIMTIFSFTFHICLFTLPLLLLSHIILWDEAWNIYWWSLPDRVADIMTIIIILSCLFFLVRRIVSPQVRFITSISDYIILSITAAPFITGFFAYHQLINYQLFLILHILTGEIMIMTIPFTRLSHMLFAVFTRAYTGSEFGGVRRARDW